MKILVTGRGSSGSWRVRGEQIGKAIGAVVQPLAGLSDMRAADVILVVKRVPEDLLANIRRSGRPWVYDIVDAYPQPTCSAWDKEQATKWLQSTVERLRPNAIIWPNENMRMDHTGDAAPYPGSVVYHHHRPGIRRNPIRDQIRTIGYEGSASYIDAWLPVITTECRKRGARFVINPPELADLDVVLALRGGNRDCYCTRHWKSNVKLANAHASGTPFIGASECGYLETECGYELYADRPADLERTLKRLDDKSVRSEIAERFYLARYTLERQAGRALALLEATCDSRS